MQKTWVGVLVAAWTTMLAPADVWAQPFEMVGSRALGMAGAFVAVSDHASPPPAAPDAGLPPSAHPHACAAHRTARVSRA